MHLAAKLEDPYWLRAMLARGAPTEVRNRLGETPLFPALGPRTQANVQLLLDAGADIHARDLDKRTLLHEAADINSLTDVPLLLDLGVDPRAKDDLGYTFQKSFFDTPEHLLSDEAVTIRAKVRAWLQARGIAVEEKAARQGH
ncbi:ankyrin repeat domain-containing protein, partial [Comamonadaceae bacterium OH2545_COT-014]